VSSLLSYAAAAPSLAESELLAPITDGHVIGAMLGSALYLLIVALLAVMVGSLVRHSAAGIAIVVGVFFVLPIGLALLSSDEMGLEQYGLAWTAEMVSRSLWGQEFQVDLGMNLLLTIAWLAVPTFAATVLLRRRDV
jgi:ABC-2 type transport system permease protein